MKQVAKPSKKSQLTLLGNTNVKASGRMGDKILITEGRRKCKLDTWQEYGKRLVDLTCS